jgi:hypothetical protein
LSPVADKHAGSPDPDKAKGDLTDDEKRLLAKENADLAKEQSKKDEKAAKKDDKRSEKAGDKSEDRGDKSPVQFDDDGWGGVPVQMRSKVDDAHPGSTHGQSGHQK